MSVQVELLEKNMAKLTVELPAEDLEKALQAAYKKQKNKFSIPGFRKGKVPRNMIEKMYGPEVFYDDAINDMLPKAYADAYDESGLEIVSKPTIDIVQIEKGKPFIFTAEVAVNPAVTLGEYKGLEVEKIETVITDEDVDAEIKKEVEKNARQIVVEDRPVADGDEVVLDFEGFVDGVAFEGGKGENYSLTIGSGQFIPGFEEQLIGVASETATEVKVTFPEDYSAAELAGKEAVFNCTVHEIKTKEYPEVDDEFASEVSEFDTLEEYKADIKKNLEEAKEKENKSKMEDAIVDKAVDNASYDIPDPMVEAEIDQMMDQMKQNIQQYGMTIEQYMQYTGATEESMRADSKEQAIKRIETRIVLEAIVKAENIEVSDEKVEAEIERLAEAYNMTVDQIKGILNEDAQKQMKDELAVQEAITFLFDNAKLV